MYALIDHILETRMLFNSLKEIYDYLQKFYSSSQIKLSENKRGTWNVKYLDGIEWLTMVTWEVEKLKEEENKNVS